MDGATGSDGGGLPALSGQPRLDRMARRKPGQDRIEIRANVMLGKPVVRGTRITVEILLEKLAAGQSIAAVLRDYPQLTREDVLAALAYARRVLGTDEFIPRIRSA